MIGWLCGVAAALEPPAPERSWYVIPNAAFDTDDGFGAGARGEVAWLEDGYAPYKTAIVVQGYIAVSGYQHHRVRFDRTGIGIHHRGRVTAHLAWRQWLSDGYFGIGRGTTRDPDPDRRRYQYRLFQPFLHLTARHEVGGDWEAFLAISPKLSVVETYTDSLLEEEQPYGIEGGPAIQVLGGVLHDTREPEIAPQAGHLAEVSVRGAPQLGGQAGGFSGGLLSFRGFLGTGRVVVAGRGMAEWLVGSVPFYEMVHWGGAIPVQGMGGFETIRGLKFGRIRGPAKAVVNLELRWRVADLQVKETPIGLEVAPFVDVGTVWGQPEPATDVFPVRPAVGVGGRVLFDRTFVGRLDTGLSLDPILELDGSVTEAVTWGLYLTFDHPF